MIAVPLTHDTALAELFSREGIGATVRDHPHSSVLKEQTIRAQRL